MNPEGAELHPMAIHILDQGGLTRFVIERTDGDGVVAPGQDVLALEWDGASRAVGDVSKSTVWMQVDCSRTFAGGQLAARRGKRRLDEKRGAREPAIGQQSVHR